MPARLTYRPPYNAKGEPAAWLPKMGISGVYYIRDRKTKRLLYIGESHTGRLRKTLLRHFQKWRGFFAGTTYNENRIEVAIKPTPPKAARAHQDQQILKFDPRDNELPERNADPF